jgi:hypothetical protein
LKQDDYMIIYRRPPIIGSDALWYQTSASVSRGGFCCELSYYVRTGAVCLN